MSGIVFSVLRGNSRVRECDTFWKIHPPASILDPVRRKSILLAGLKKLRGADLFHSNFGEFLLCLRDCADGAASILNDDRFKAQVHSVDRGEADTVVVGQAGEEDAPEAALAEVAGETG